jgi:uncharacterized membrane protein
MRRTVAEGFRYYFLRGLLTLLPLAVTLWLIGTTIRMLDGILDFFPRWLQPDFYLPFTFPGMRVVSMLALIWLIGFLATNVVSNRLHDLWNGLVRRIPIVSGVYAAVRQLAMAIFSEPTRSFRRVVMIEYPRPGLYALGFVTGVAEGELQERSRERVVNVFIPTTPNPTSGWYVLVPEKDAIALDMTVEEAFKLIVSGGIVVPERRAGQHG